MAMLSYYVLVMVIELSLAFQSDARFQFKIVARYIAAAASAAASATILLMPFREPSLPSVNISAVGQESSSDFRSPEDNLKLWQFLTVSWMAPLISTGSKRKLNESDVWLLGFDFQHSRLHEKFRRLRGSVLARVLRANGIEVFFTCAVSTITLICGTFHQPILLCPFTNFMHRVCGPSVAATTFTSYERSIAAKACGFDLCVFVTGIEARCCPVWRITHMVWPKII